MATHECMLQCTRKTDRDYAICTEHLRMLPKDLSIAIRRAYAHGMTRDNASSALWLALGAADRWIIETFGGRDRKPWDPGAWERLKRSVREKDAARAARRAAMAAGSEPEPAPTFRHLRLVP